MAKKANPTSPKLAKPKKSLAWVVVGLFAAAVWPGSAQADLPIPDEEDTIVQITFPCDELPSRAFEDVPLAVHGDALDFLNPCPAENRDGGGGGSTGPSYPYDPPVPPRQRDIHVKAYGEDSYSNAYGNFWDSLFHIADAIIWQSAMWSQYTGNNWAEGRITSIQDIRPSGGGSWGDCSDHLGAFSDYLTDNGLRDSALNEVYTIVTGDASLLDDCWGTAHSAGIGQRADEPDSLLVGRDESGYDPYQGQSKSMHLAKVLAQEVGHNWGEPNHECYPANGPSGGTERSIMCNAGLWSQKKFWLHYSDREKPPGVTPSADRIIEGTKAYD